MARSLTNLASRLFLPLVAGIAVFAYVEIFATGLVATPARSDAFSYYLYLPSWVIFHDPSLEAYAASCCAGTYPNWSGVTRWEATGRWVNPHPIGVAVLALPLFVAAHEVNLVVPVSYRHATGLAGVLYLVAGLHVLKRLLARHFSEGAVVATLVAITFGTNLLHYGTYDSLWSHVYSFFLFACLLYLAETWTDEPTIARSVLIGLVVGLIFLVRHANVLFAIVVPLFGIVDRASAIARARALLACRGRIALAVAVAAVVAFPQILMYWTATGFPLIDPYSQLMRLSGMRPWHLESPHLLGTLFTLPKGLLFWSPVLVLSLAGLFLLRGRPRGFLVPAVVYLALNAYLAASWVDWQLGASFGNRAFTESLALFAIPMAAFYQRVSARPRLALLAAAFTVVGVALSIVQMYQYWIGALAYSDITWAQYRSQFLSFRVIRR